MSSSRNIRRCLDSRPVSPDSESESEEYYEEGEEVESEEEEIVEEEDKQIDLGFFQDVLVEEVERSHPSGLPRHPWLVFPESSGDLSRGMMHGRLHQLASRSFGIISSLDLSNVATTALLQRIEDFQSFVVRDDAGNVLFTDPSFRNLVRIVQPVFPVLCFEFFATLEVDKTSVDFAAGDYVSFRLGGERRQCSLFEFGCRLGLYSQETCTYVFQAHLAASMDVGSPEFNAVTFWPTVGTGSFRSCAKVSCLRTLPLRMLAKMIITHIQHRTEASKLNLQDLFFLWCFVMGRPLNLPRILLLQICRRGASIRATSPIHSGHLITALARSYDFDLSGLRSQAAKLLGHSGLSNWQLIYQVDDMWVLREGLISDTRDGGAAAAEPRLRPPRLRARPASVPQSSMDQLSTQFAQIDSRLTDIQGGIRDLRYRHDVSQQWSERMFAGVYESQCLLYPDGCQVPLSYYPSPSYYQPRGYDPDAPGPSYFPPGYDPSAPGSSYRYPPQ